MKVKGDRIRKLRDEKGLTLSDLAQKSEISISYLSELERGTKQPSLKSLNKIATALNVPREEIVALSLESPALNFGDRTRFAREKRGLTLTETAERLGLSLQYISDIEKNKVVPAVSTIKNIAKVLDIPVSILLNGDSSIGIKLRTIREEQGVTQVKLAEMAALSPGLITQIEKGKVQPSFKTIEKLAKVLGVSPCYFVLDNENIEEMLPAFSQELRSLLQDDNVQAILRVVCHMNQKELQFVLNFIQMFKKSNIEL
jgi:transcriptional regulator with XRE-family HTH domain